MRCAWPVQRGENSGRQGDEHEHGQGLHAIDHQLQQFQRRRIGPMHVLVQGQHRPVRSQSRQLIDQRLERALLLLLRAQLQRRIAVAGRNRQQCGEQRRRPGDIIGRLAR